MKETITRFTTDALVIKESIIGESDRLVTLFTRDYGIIKAFASGAGKLTSKKSSSTALLTYSTMSIAKRKDTYKIYEAQPIRVFFSIGSDIERLSISQYFCELALQMVPAELPNEEFLRLILNSLHFLGENSKDVDLIKAITEFRAAAISGYMPNLVSCSRCGKFEDDIMYFDLSEARLFCSDCNQSNAYIPVSPTVLSAMRHIVYSELKKYFKDKEYVFNTVIPRNIRLAEAPSYGKPCIVYDPESKGAIAYLKLAKEILERDGK